jgi:hypothetical protein
VIRDRKTFLLVPEQDLAAVKPAKMPNGLMAAAFADSSRVEVAYSRNGGSTEVDVTLGER